MCLNTCLKKRNKIVHSVSCPLLTHFRDGSPIPFDWQRMSLGDKIHMKEQHSRSKAKIKTSGNLRNVTAFANSLVWH